ncbi:hypothetical protein TALC_00157 [Thermoplasmatales archaeon BRNA1]|nr:hypothetical protein TALC_00157 [Thermoplasmatales archaeon BRNA1]
MFADAKKSGAAYGWVAILAIAVFICAWIAAYSADSSWSWTESCLGDFGISDNEDAVHYFNYGCLLSGILLAAYGAGKASYEAKIGYKISGLLTAFVGISVLFLGVFTLDYAGGDYFRFFGMLAAILVACSLIAECAGLWIDGGSKRAIAGIGIVFAIVVGTCALGLALEEAEHVGVALALAWFVIDGVVFLASHLSVKKAENKECAC